MSFGKPSHTVACSGDYSEPVQELLDSVVDRAKLRKAKRILIKPNLVNDSPPPVTTPVSLVRAIFQWFKDNCSVEVVLAEGCGDVELETPEIFACHGYNKFASEEGVTLVDLNHAPVIELANPDAMVFKTFKMPAIVMDSFVVSVAQLKAHSLSGVTLTMKNMIGCAPPRFYQQGGRWKKAAFHARIDDAIFDLNSYKLPDIGIIDATTGLAEYHLGGPICSPAPEKLIGGMDPVAVDAAGARLLGHDWRKIGYINMVHTVLGQAC